MNKEELEKRKKELLEKIDKAENKEEVAEIRKEIDELVASEAVTNMREERENLRDSLGRVEMRSLTEVREVRQPEERASAEFDRETVLASAEYRSAWAKKLMVRNDFTEAERRALGVALTTTATEFVAPTADVDGVNNGGLFIPESVSLAILKEIELTSPFLADVAKTFIRGNIKFPYKVSGSGAEWATEGVCNTDESDEFAELILTSKELSKTIRITWKLEAMAVEEFISYMVSEIAREMNEELAGSAFYGTGVSDITGVTIGATVSTYDGTTTKVLDAIGAGLMLLSPRKSLGAVIYIARDIENEIMFQKDANGTYQNSPLFLSGVTRIGSYTVKVDPFLKSGEFLIGNARNYKMNFNEGFSVTKDVHGKCRVNDYTGYSVVAAAPVPNSFVYGKKGI